MPGSKPKQPQKTESPAAASEPPCPHPSLLGTQQSFPNSAWLPNREMQRDKGVMFATITVITETGYSCSLEASPPGYLALTAGKPSDLSRPCHRGSHHQQQDTLIPRPPGMVLGGHTPRPWSQPQNANPHTNPRRYHRLYEMTRWRKTTKGWSVADSQTKSL